MHLYIRKIELDRNVTVAPSVARAHYYDRLVHDRSRSIAKRKLHDQRKRKATAELLGTYIRNRIKITCF